MSELLDKVSSLPNICGVELAFSGAMVPSVIEGYQVFYNSMPSGIEFADAYIGKSTVAFNEESDTGNGGISYTQKLTIRFPATDSRRAERLALMHTLTYVKIKLTNKKHLLLGRNDFEQNIRPLVKIKIDDKIAQAEITTVSISPTGYTPVYDLAGLPILFPINFFNPDE